METDFNSTPYIVSPQSKRKFVQYWMDAVADEAPGIDRKEIVLEALFYAAMQYDPAQVAQGWVHWQLQLGLKREESKIPVAPIVSIEETLGGCDARS